MQAYQDQPAKPVGRLAPSPTGGLHLGHARTFLIAWWASRSEGGRIVLRIEDLDQSRVRPGMAEQAVRDLQWVGLNWDEGPDRPGSSGPYIQSIRMAHYEDALERLKRSELVYPCTCTRADIARAVSAPHAHEEGPKYPGTCASRSASFARELTGRPFAWRFRASGETISWIDLHRGPLTLGISDLGGDFVVYRSDGSPSYQLAVVVDDAAMGVNQVIRGDDLVPSTPRQILLYQALGLNVPRFGHVPLAIDHEGRRLAKRDQAIKLSTLREEGISAERVLASIARSCGLPVLGEEKRPSDWLESFSIASVPADPWVVEPDWLGNGGL